MTGAKLIGGGAGETYFVVARVFEVNRKSLDRIAASLAKASMLLLSVPPLK